MRQFVVSDLLAKPSDSKKARRMFRFFVFADLALKKRNSAILKIDYFNIYWRCNVILRAFKEFGKGRTAMGRETPVLLV